MSHTVRGKHCRHPIVVMGVVDMFGPALLCYLVVKLNFNEKVDNLTSESKKPGHYWDLSRFF